MLTIALLLSILLVVALTFAMMARIGGSVPGAVGSALSEFGRECGTVSLGGGIEQPGDGEVVIHFMIGDGFLGPGDDWWTRPVDRDVLSPPLRDGERVSFVDDKVPSDIRREAGCGPG